MDFFKLLQSLDELLYEVVSWLLFYPVTLWRVIKSPLKLMMAAESELLQAERKQFDDVIPPPLFLLLTLIIAHLVELAILGRSKLAVENPELSNMLGNDINLTVFRVLMLSILPLAASIRLVQARGLKLDREILKAPFYAQCYAAALFTILLVSAFAVAGHQLSLSHPGFLSITALALLWLLVIETHWYSAQLKVSLIRGFAQASILLAQWLVMLVGVLLVLS
jgi:hypothetical protein